MIPKDIDIYGRMFSVEEREDIFVNGRNDNMGASCFSEQKIEINAKLSEDHKQDTFTHEVTHMAMCENGLADLFTDNQIESICNLCASVCRVIRQNEKRYSI